MRKWLVIQAIIVIVIVIFSTILVLGFMRAEGISSNRTYSVGSLNAEIVMGGNISSVTFVGYEGNAGSIYTYKIVLFNSDRNSPINVTSIETTTTEFTIVNTTVPLPLSIPGDSYIYVSINIGSTYAAAGYTGDLDLVITEKS